MKARLFVLMILVCCVRVPSSYADAGTAAYDVSGSLSIASPIATETIDFSFQLDYYPTMQPGCGCDAALVDPVIGSIGPLQEFTTTNGLASQGYVGFFNGAGDEIDLFENLGLGVSPNPPEFTGTASFFSCQSAACQLAFPGEQPLGYGIYSGTASVAVTQVIGTPEPSSWLMLALGVLAVVALALSKSFDASSSRL